MLDFKFSTLLLTLHFLHSYKDLLLCLFFLSGDKMNSLHENHP